MFNFLRRYLRRRLAAHRKRRWYALRAKLREQAKWDQIHAELREGLQRLREKQ